MPSYARTFILSDKSKNTIGAPVTGPGEPGEYTQEAGFLSYYEVCDIENASSFIAKTAF